MAATHTTHTTHTIVGSPVGGRLTGYAGGLARKRFLLDLEEAPAAKLCTVPEGETR